MDLTDGRWVPMLSDDVERDTDQQIQVVQQAIGRADIPIELVATCLTFMPKVS